MAEAGGVQSVDRAAAALEFVARQQIAGVSEVAAELGVHISTASRLLAALAARSLVEQIDGARGRYRLGPTILRLAATMTGGLDLPGRSAELCAGLAERLGETVNVAVRNGLVAINVLQHDGGAVLTVNSWVGRPTPLHATSSGKVLLAHAPEHVRQRALADLPAYTAQTATDPVILEAQLTVVERAGFAVTVGELEVGLNAVAVPIRDYSGAVVAALSVSGPAARMPAERLPELVDAVAATAADIGKRLGHAETL
jgi:DNA-binding IclR family transcriptional regulator